MLTTAIVSEAMRSKEFEKAILDNLRGAIRGVSMWIILVVFAVAALTGNRADALGAPPEECYRAARFAAHETSVPVNVLLAIARVETGRKIDDKIQPWPWALNHAGKGVWLKSEAELLELALSLIADGERLFDVGCFQLNYHWHGAEFASLDEMISPRSNALYAAHFLEALFAEFGDWTEAVGAYHSRTEALADSYKAKFLRHYAEEGRDEPVQLALKDSNPRVSKRANSYPLLIARPQKARLGSLVPESTR